MILKPISIYIDGNGDAYDVESTTMYRFTNVNFIRLITPMTTQLSMSITFLLDTGVSIETKPMNPSAEAEMVEVPLGSGNFEVWNVWTYPVPNAVTATVAVFKASKLYTSFVQKEIINEGEENEYVRGNTFGMTELTVDPTIQAPEGDVSDATVADALADSIADLYSITSKLAKENLPALTFVEGTELIEVRINGSNSSMSVAEFKSFVEQGITVQQTFNSRADTGIFDAEKGSNYTARVLSDDARYDNIGSTQSVALTDADLLFSSTLFDVGAINGLFNGIASNLVMDGRVLSNSGTLYFRYFKRLSNGDEIAIATSEEVIVTNTSFGNPIEIPLITDAVFSINGDAGEQFGVKFYGRNTVAGQDTTGEFKSMGTPATTFLVFQLPAQSVIFTKMDKLSNPNGNRILLSLLNGNIEESEFDIDEMMVTIIYDSTGNGIVDNSEQLGGQLPSYYAIDADTEKVANKDTNGGYMGIDANGDAITPRDHNVQRDLDVDNDINVDNNLDVGNDLNVIGATGMTGLVTMQNGLVVYGTVDFRSGVITKVGTDEIEVKDQRILVNAEQIGTPSTANLGGIEVERGDLANYIFAFRELDDSFVIGKDGGTLQKVATREDTPTDLGFARWDDATKKFVTVTDVTQMGAMSDGKFVIWDNASGKIITKNEILLSDIEPINLEDLNDTPAYAGFGGYDVHIKSTEDGVEYIRPNNNSTTGIEDADTVVPSINVDTTKYDVSAGVIKFVDESVSPPVTNVINLGATVANVITGIATRDRTYLAINSLGNIIELGGFPSEEEYRNLVPFALAFHPDGVNITSIDPVGWIATQASKNAIDVGGLFIPTNKTGNDFAPNGVNMNLDVSAGQMKALGANRVVSPTNPNITAQNGFSINGFILIYRDGAGGIIFDDNGGSLYTTIEDWFDNNSGVIVPNPSNVNGATIHRISRSPRTGISYILIGQNSYASITDAIASRVAFTDSVDDIPTFIGEDLVFRTYFSVRKGATNLSTLSDAELFNTQGDTGTVAGGVATSLNDTQVSSTSVLGGLAPQINQKGVNEYFENKGIRLGGIILPTNPINADFLYNTLFTLAVNDLYIVQFGTSGSGATARLSLNNGVNYYNVIDENDGALIGTDVDGTIGMYYWTGTTFKRFIDDKILALFDLKLDLTGGIMSGVLDMNFNTIDNLPTPTAGGHATRKIYVDDEIALVAGAGRTKTVKENEDDIATNVTAIGLNTTHRGLIANENPHGIALDNVLPETLAMPTAGWNLIGDFYEVTVTIGGAYTASDYGVLVPILDTLVKYTAWTDMELVRVTRVSDTSIKLFAIASNPTAFDFEFNIVTDDGGL
jgi:hypothetical protein